MPLQREANREKVTIEQAKKDFNDFFIVSSTPCPQDNGLRLYFAEDPLPEVIAILRQGYPPYKAFANVIDSDNEIEVKVTQEDVDIAQLVKRHFLNKYLMMTLNNQPLSKFQETVQGMLSDPTSLKGCEVQALVKLYHFYLEDKGTESIIKDAKDIVDTHKPLSINGTVTFVGNVRRNSRDAKFMRYFWKTEDGHLIKMDANTETSEYQAWRMVAKEKQLRICGDLFTVKLQGQDFVVGDLKRSRFEILD